MKTFALAAVGCAVLAGSAYGQSEAAAKSALTFEVASIKPSDPRQSSVDFVISPGGRLRATNVTLGDMIGEAYQVKGHERSGGPSWVDTARFHIEARAAGEPSRREMLAMLQSLLVERFQLKVRREQREGDVFELVVGRGRPRLVASTADSSFLRLRRNTPPELPGVSYTILAQKISMAKLADELTGTLQRPVLDKTGIAGEFDFEMDYGLDGAVDAGPAIFTAVQEQLGLRLQRAKGPVESLIVESAERPSAN